MKTSPTVTDFLLLCSFLLVAWMDSVATAWSTSARRSCDLQRLWVKEAKMKR